jgi:4-hydroxy-2-oxoheptanedioate aldolase
MKKKHLGYVAALSVLAAAVAVAQPAAAQPAAANQSAAMAAPAPAGKRINRAIEVLASGQPVYYTQVAGGGYEDGKRLAATKADYILYDMEHGLFDLKELREFMRGVVDAGLTRTGHRMVPVIATLPMAGMDEASTKANVWMIQQALAAGIHGILLCQVESPEAARILVEATRYPFAPTAVGLNHGMRGAGSQGYASRMWGLSGEEYMRRADVWPLNPDGEILLGVKLENPRSVLRSEEITRIPGIAFAEWGPGDQAFYLVGPPRAGQGNQAETHPEMIRARARVLAATKAAKIYFLNSCSEANVIQQIDEGTRICTGGDSPAADKGRAYTKRTTPW